VANPSQEDDVAPFGVGDSCQVDDSVSFKLESSGDELALFFNPNPDSSVPVSMVVTDPTGDSIGIDSATGAIFNTIQDQSVYDTTQDINADGIRDDRVHIPQAIAGDYNVRIQRRQGSDDNAKFTLSIRVNGNQNLSPDQFQNATASAVGTSIPDTIVYVTATTFPGDVNASGEVTAADIIYTVVHVFKGGPGAVVEDHADVNCDGVVTASDIIFLVNFAFKGGEAPCSQSAG
jgi:hypothetical protein